MARVLVVDDDPDRRIPSGYASGKGAADVLPVDVYVPGCPPRPEEIIEGLLLAVGRLPRRGSA